MRKMSFYSKNRNNEALKTLSGALASSRKNSSVSTPGNPVSQGSFGSGVSGSYSNNSNDDSRGYYQFGKGLGQIYNAGKEKGWFNFGSADTSDVGNGAASGSLDMSLGNAEGLSFLGNGSGGNIDNLSFMNSGSSLGGGGGIDSLSFSNLGSAADTGTAASSGGGFSWGSGGSGGGGMPWGAIAGVAKQGYNYITDQDPSEYSDLEQSTIYPLQGAAIGGSYGGGWGALGGALYGLGYSFKDDVGLKDNDWLTTVLFPIGMGDEHKGIIQV